MQTPVKMAVCCYVMDKDKNLLVTKRPDHLKIFPSVWVLPGGIVEPHEPLEIGLFRELEEEVGLTLEYRDDVNNTGDVIMTSPLHFDHPDELAVRFEPYYLYESVTHNVIDQVLDLPGYKERPEDIEAREKQPPAAQHLCLFYKAQIDESFDRIMLSLNKHEVQRAGWCSLEQLRDTFNLKSYSTFQKAF
jgi:8-oxo-dGTP pyrophosphatase MutT (NUDIX family)